MRSKLILSLESRLELEWWIKNVQTISGRSLQEQPPSLVIFSDAYFSGWGVVCGDQTTSGPWTTGDLSKHINELELLGAFYALRCFAECLNDWTILLKLYRAQKARDPDQKGYLAKTIDGPV